MLALHCKQLAKRSDSKSLNNDSDLTSTNPNSVNEYYMCKTLTLKEITYVKSSRYVLLLEYNDILCKILWRIQLAFKGKNFSNKLPQQQCYSF